ncbi:cupin domain-containing protein [bacterium]|nr:cupin domain-containing protein [bacterium]
MEYGKSRWVLGHHVKPLETAVEFALMEIRSPAGVPGPPPHYHDAISEFFYVVRGRLDLMTDGEWRTLNPGDSAVAPPGTVHTFINNGEEDALWLTTFSPRGFERFFEDFGVTEDGEKGFLASVAPDVLARVGATCGDYGMIIKEHVR